MPAQATPSSSLSKSNKQNKSPASQKKSHNNHQNSNNHLATPVDNAFRMLDSNGDGVVTRAEFQQAMQVF